MNAPVPSNVVADAAVANEVTVSNAIEVAMMVLRRYFMASPFRVWLHE